MDKTSIQRAIECISALMMENRSYLVSLDQANGDGDLGISMDDGFRALSAFVNAAEETDLGQLMRAGGKVFNEAAPSSLGTILAFGFMGMARSLKGKTDVDFTGTAEAMKAGVDNIMAKAESRPGEKTIVDALVPGAAALVDAAGAVSAGTTSVADAFASAAAAAGAGSESTKQMVAVHGRAAYSAERSIGILDGGSVVGKLIFDGLSASVTNG